MIKFDRSRPPRRVYLTASRVAARGPALIVSATGADTTDVGNVTIYDGVDTNGVLVMKLKNIKDETVEQNPVDGVFCEHGIYVSLGTNSYALLSYYPGEYVLDRTP